MQNGPENDEKLPAGEEEGLDPRQKTAVLMVALGQENAAAVLKFLTDYESEDITQTIT